MLKIEAAEKTLSALDQAPLGDLMKRYDLHDFISNSPEAFFDQIGEKLFLIGKDVEPSKAVPIQIDLLAVDQSGQAVLVILQRGKEQTSLARAITCAGLMASWKPENFFERLSEAQAGQLRSFLEVRAEEINLGQRTILIGEVFDFEVLTATKWLWERNRMDNTCIRVFLTADPKTGAEYLGCTDLSEDRRVSSVLGANGRPPPGKSAFERPQLLHSQPSRVSAQTDRQTVASG